MYRSHLCVHVWHYRCREALEQRSQDILSPSRDFPSQHTSMQLWDMEHNLLLAMVSLVSLVLVMANLLCQQLMLNQPFSLHMPLVLSSSRIHLSEWMTSAFSCHLMVNWLCSFGTV